MAPDRGSRGSSSSEQPLLAPQIPAGQAELLSAPSQCGLTTSQILASRASDPSNFTLRSILLGLVIGVIIVFSNTYFGLQTGWISGMAMPSALIGFAFFKAVESNRLLSSWMKMPFSPVENVLVQTVAGSVGTMPLGCGFVGVIPALEFLLSKDENGPLRLSLGRLCIWAVGICLFGVVMAVPLRREVIIKEKLKFPSGTATALMIGVLHGEKEDAAVIQQDDHSQHDRSGDGTHDDDEEMDASGAEMLLGSRHFSPTGSQDWKLQIRLLLIAFGGSAVYTIFTYFVPQVRNIPLFGVPIATKWLWTLNPSPAYVGQGIIMGTATTMHMLLGAILGWAVLSPLAKHQGWAPADVDEWDGGSKGWIVWVSLAIMLADALVSLGWLVLRPLIHYASIYIPFSWPYIKSGNFGELAWRLHTEPPRFSKGYKAVNSHESADVTKTSTNEEDDDEESDAPPSHLVSNRALLICTVVALAAYFAAIPVAFPNLLPFGATVLALILAGLLSIMGIRALGETDLNPVSGISKLTQLIFAAVIPSSNPNAVTINLLAGAISESGAIQAGDLMQDLKAGHLLGASPAAQFYGQMIGSVVGALVSAVVYKLYTAVYTVPGDQFQVPTAFVWIFTARLVTGKGLPEAAGPAAIIAAAIFAVLTSLRIATRGRPIYPYIPGGIAVAVGMYNTPSFTLARAAGGVLVFLWMRRRGAHESAVVVLASGLILGEGLLSIVNLGMASAGVPHL